MTKTAIGTVGTLQELHVECGDVVECVYVKTRYFTTGSQYVADAGGYILSDDGSKYNETTSRFRLISRASDQQSGRPKTWGEMTDAEKGALLLSKYEGATVFILDLNGEWAKAYFAAGRDPYFAPDRVYSVNPPGAKRETVTLTNFHGSARGCYITFDTLNGEPDCSTVKMEKL